MNISKKNEFLEKFAKLCEEYDATISYNTDDDGVHVFLGIDEIFNGFLNGEYLGNSASKELRAAKDK